MQVATPPQPLITVKEARKLLGAVSKDLSDDQVKDLIATLTSVAEAYISNPPVRKNQ
jgi:hypothetical protein